MDDIDDEDDFRTVGAETLRISYREPRTGVPLTEDVFIDPRDCWCGKTDGSTLLVTSSAIEALQRQLTAEQTLGDASLEALNLCRRDYLREHQYLVEELRKVADAIKVPSLAAELQTTLQTALALSEAAAEDASSIAKDSELADVCSQVYNRDKDDEEFVKCLTEAGLTPQNELTMRIYLRRMQQELGDLLIERNRLRAIVDAVDGPGADLVQAMFAAADMAGADLLGMLEELMTSVTEDKQKAIHVMVTRDIEKRYAELLEKYKQNEDRVAGWKNKVAAEEAQQAELDKLNSEVAEYESRVEDKLRREEADRQEARAAHAAEIKKIEAERKKIMEENAQIERENAKIKDPDVVDLSNIWGKLTKDQQMKIKGLETSAQRAIAEESSVVAQIQAEEQKVQEKAARKDRLRTEVSQAEQAVADIESEVATAEKRIDKLEDLEADGKYELRQMQKKRAELEEQWEVAQMPVPDDGMLDVLEQEVAEAQKKNKDFEAELAEVEAREREYESEVSEAKAAWESRARVLEEEENIKLAKRGIFRPKKAPKPPKPDDPDLQDYHDRIKHPKYADMPRYLQLSKDDSCNEKRVRVKRDVLDADEKQRRLACVQPVVYHMPSEKDGSLAPSWFRRSEDLRVKLAGVHKEAGKVEGDLQSREGLRQGLLDELGRLCAELSKHALSAAELQTVSSQRLTESLDAVETAESQRSEDELALREALQSHQASSSVVKEAWALAEKACARGVTEAQVNEEEQTCADREAAFVSASQVLYKLAAQTCVALENTKDPRAEAFRRYCQDMEAAGATLDAVKLLCSGFWQQLRQVATDFEAEMAVYGPIRSLFDEKDRQRKLLSAEITAPPEARRALASVRAALTAGAPLKDAILSVDPLRHDAIMAAAVESKAAKALEEDSEAAGAALNAAHDAMPATLDAAEDFTVKPTRSYRSRSAFLQ
eukprot:TRINITY_DN22532_c0_g1_i1.p1 TRINITY_DN22532_c0_g1~~TRINITY_DN22532_c0_g1_i1.p1  ORF type:complete len:944 (-),score=327.83 TRINITY_DN22532_c0_g1_i1:337-3168(-)